APSNAAMVASTAPMVRTRPNREVTHLPTEGYRLMSFSHRIQPARTVMPPRAVMTLAAFRFFTAALRRGPAAGPTSAADGPMNPTNRKADPTQSTPARMWNILNTSMNGDVAINPRSPFG